MVASSIPNIFSITPRIDSIPWLLNWNKPNQNAALNPETYPVVYRQKEEDTYTSNSVYG